MTASIPSPATSMIISIGDISGAPVVHAGSPAQSGSAQSTKLSASLSIRSLHDVSPEAMVGVKVGPPGVTVGVLVGGTPTVLVGVGVATPAHAGSWVPVPPSHWPLVALHV